MADVFLSYARGASTAPVRTLADALAAAGVSAFVDDREIAYGNAIPDAVIAALLGARIVVVYAEPVYFTRWYCQLEYAAALAGFRRLVEHGVPEAERVAALAHLVVALPPGGVTDAELDALPGPIRATNWARADGVAALAGLVRQRLAEVAVPLRDRLAAVLDPSELRALFGHTAPLPQPLRLAALPGAPRLPVWVPLGMRGTLRDRFVGRADDLWRLHDALAPASTTTGRAALTGALRGVGGVGKTQLAAEYLYRYGPRHYTGGVFWLDATQPAPEQHHAILRALGAEVPDLRALRQQVGADGLAAALQERLAAMLRDVPAGRPVLLIVDDVPEPALGMPPAPLETWCPAPDAAACLVTSRLPVQFAAGTALSLLNVDVLAPDDAVAVLTGPGVDRAALADSEWRAVAAWVGHLPLALTLLYHALRDDMAALSPAQVLARATAGRSVARELDAAMAALRESVPPGSLRGVSEAFLLSYKRLPPAAQDAARLLAQFGPEPIPQILVDALGWPLAGPSVRAALRTRAFVTATPTDAGDRVPLFGTVHRVLADFLRQLNDPGGGLTDLGDAVRTALLRVMTPKRCRTPAAWPVIRLCVPHAEYVLVAGGKRQEGDASTVVALAYRLALYRWARHEVGRSRSAAESAVGTATSAFGREHPITVATMHNLGLALNAQGEHTRARALYERIHEIRTRTLGFEDPRTLEAMTHLAVTLTKLGEHSAARTLHERVLEMRTRTRGPDHRDSLNAMDNLARVRRAEGDLPGARALGEEVIERSTRVLGPDHITTLRSMDSLARTLTAQGEFGLARALHRAALEARTRRLGPEHPRTLRSMSDLAAVLYAEGDYAAAREQLGVAYQRFRRVLGAEHPETRRSRKYLRRIARKQNALERAQVVDQVVDEE